MSEEAVDERQRVLDEIAARFESFAGEAKAIRTSHDYKGALTPEMFIELEDLLRKPTPPQYVEHTPARRQRGDAGLPYAVTGLKSQQFQIDRMNDVLGRQHWRKLLHYEQGGSICKAIVIVGNNLAWARIVDGELSPFTVFPDGTSKEAEVFAVVEGWGGHKAPDAGNTYKGAETNASKRAIAQLGPGADVYRVDWDPDALEMLHGRENGNGESAPPRPRQQHRAPTPQPQAPQPQPREITDAEAAERLRQLLIYDESKMDPDELRLAEARRNAEDAMMSMPEAVRPNVQKRYKLIASRRNDLRELENLVTRSRNAVA